MARRCAQRRRTRVHDQVVRQGGQQADRACADWRAGFRTGLRGDSYVHPIDCDGRSWREGFMEGAGRRARPVRVRS
jgi:hypothetical protein